MALFKFQLIEKWWVVAKDSWSARLAALSGLLSALEFGLPYLDFLFPRGLFALLAMVVSLAAYWARLVVQQRMREELGGEVAEESQR